MSVTLEKTKEWLRVESNDEDALINSYILAAEDIITGILRFPISEFEVIPETVNQAMFYSIAEFYEKRNELSIIELMETLKIFLAPYRRESW